MSEYEFSNEWFEQNRAVWEVIIAKWKPRKVLEIGSFEGRSTCFLIEKISQYENPEIYCLDTWEGGEEHAAINMVSVENRFKYNTKLANEKTGERSNLVARKGMSGDELVRLISEGHKNSFDLVYIDGSHQAPDVLVDLVLSYQLCKTGGVIICDDYLWKMGGNLLHEPKIAIDSFVNIYRDKVSLLLAPLLQIYLLKVG